MVRVVVRSETTTIDFHAEAIDEFEAIAYAEALIRALANLKKVMAFGEVALTLQKDRED